MKKITDQSGLTMTFEFTRDATSVKDKISKVDVGTLQKVVYRELKSGITGGRFTPGETITIRSVASAAGTSVMPVREALQRLVAEGAVEARPNRTFSIPIQTRASIDELYRVRKVLEGMAAAEACDRCTPELIAELTAQVATMEAASKAGHFDELLEGNYRFHFALYGAAQSHHLISIIESLWMKSGPLLRAIGEGDTRPKRSSAASQDFHIEMIEALKRRDRLAVVRALEADLDIAASWYRDHFAVREVSALNYVDR